MIKKSKLIKRIQRLHYFDSDLQINKEKVQNISTKDSNEHKRFYGELKIVRKLLTIHTYTQCAKSYDIIENPHQIITKEQFRKNVTSSVAEKAEDGTIVVGNIPAQYMPDDEFEIMLEIYYLLKK
jgi:hypothetical protein